MKDIFKEEYQSKLVSTEDAVKTIRSGERIYIGTCTSIAHGFTRELGRQKDRFDSLYLFGSNINKPLEILDGTHPGVKLCTYFMGGVERAGLKSGMTDYTSVHLSQVDRWVHETARVDTAVLEVSPPDEDGYFSFGATGVCCHTYFLEEKRAGNCRIILEVNPKAPYVFGDCTKIHISEADLITEHDEEPFAIGDLPVSPELETISHFLIDEIKDGDVLQFGIGGLANAVGFGLTEKNDLGSYTELIGDSIMYLMKNGNITNKRKGYFPGKTVVSFALGSSELYRFLDRNEDIWYQPMPYVNNPANIAKNDNMVSINNVLSVDLYGQVVADNIEGRQYSGVGGQIDFVRGAQMSKGGRSYLCLKSTFENKRTGRGSTIVPYFKPGTAVTTPRSEVQYIVTEYGCIDLKKLTMKERAGAIISLAHPDYRPELTKAAKEMGLL
ncbi:MAG: acetyl-CoA hydrolase [Eubacterium sp.]|nr:acetyl-CoA hydrolase [Eubacterium sp.]